MIIYPDKIDLDKEMKKADAGDIEAMIKAAFVILFTRKAENRDAGLKARAVSYYEKAVRAGNKTAMRDLAAAYIDGRGVERNNEKAFELYEMARDDNSGGSCHSLGCIRKYKYIEKGLEIPETDAERVRSSVAYFERGTELGDSGCMYELGELYLFGNGVEQDMEKAFRLLMEAYDNIDEWVLNDRAPRIFFRLGQCYMNGWGTEVEKTAAYEMFDKAVRKFSYRIKKGYSDENDYLEESKKYLSALEKELYTGVVRDYFGKVISQPGDIIYEFSDLKGIDKDGIHMKDGFEMLFRNLFPWDDDADWKCVGTREITGRPPYFYFDVDNRKVFILCDPDNDMEFTKIWISILRQGYATFDMS